MSNGTVNKVILIGRCGNQPDVKQSKNGSSIVSFSVATSESWRDKQSGEKQENTQWHRCVAYGKLGEIIAQYAGKGDKLYIEGKLNTREWQDKDGNKRQTTEIVVEEMQLMGNKPQGQPAQQPAQQQPQRQPAPQQSAADEFFGDDTDLPF
jgi:single-strand DNA-binding protein